MSQPVGTGGRWSHTPVRRGAGVSRQELERREEALTRAPLFQHLPKRHLRSIAKVTGISRTDPDRPIVEEGKPGSEFFVILEGGARVVRRGRTVARLAAGDFFGEISLIDGGPRTASVIADRPTSCLTLAGRDFREILAREPTLSLRVIDELARRLRERAKSPVE